MSTWFKVDNSIVEHPKFVGLTADAWCLWIHAAAYASRNLTDGLIPTAMLPRLAPIKNATRIAAELVAAGVWEKADSGWVIHDWGEHQVSASDVHAVRKSRTESGSIGNHKRWHVAKNKVDPDCPHCIANQSQTRRKPVANAIANQSQTRRKPVADIDIDINSQSSQNLTIVGNRICDDDDRVTDLAEMLADSDEAAARAAGITIRNQTKWRVAAVTNRMAEAAKAVNDWPDMPLAELAAKISGAPAPVTAETSPVLATIARDRSCPDCHGTGWTVDDDDTAIACKCSHTATATA